MRATQSKLGYQRVAQLYDRGDLFLTDIDKTFAEALEANNIEVVARETENTASGT